MLLVLASAIAFGVLVANAAESYLAFPSYRTVELAPPGIGPLSATTSWPQAGDLSSWQGFWRLFSDPALPARTQGGPPESIVFPAVTVCSSHGVSRQRLEALPSASPASLGNAEVEGVVRTVSELVLSCTFDGLKCLPSDMLETLSGDFGACFTFNIGPTSIGGVQANAPGGTPLVATSTSAKDGLQLVLDLTPDDAVWSSAIPFGQETAASTTGMPSEGHLNATTMRSLRSGSDGTFALVSVHPAHEQAPTSSPASVHAVPGTLTEIGFSRVDRLRLPAPFSSCEPWPHAASGAAYSATACMDACIARTVLAACGCRRLPWPRLSPEPTGVPACMHPNDTGCELGVALAAETGTACGEGDCPVPCAESSFTLRSLSAAWPPLGAVDEVAEWLRNSRAPSAAGRNSSLADMESSYSQRGIAVVRVHPTALRAEVSRDVAALSTIRLLATVGGLSALLLGASFMTCLEFVECGTMSALGAASCCCGCMAGRCCKQPKAMRDRRGPTASAPAPNSSPSSYPRRSALRATLDAKAAHPTPGPPHLQTGVRGPADAALEGNRPVNSSNQAIAPHVHPRHERPRWSQGGIPIVETTSTVDTPDGVTKSSGWGADEAPKPSAPLPASAARPADSVVPAIQGTSFNAGTARGGNMWQVASGPVLPSPAVRTMATGFDVSPHASASGARRKPPPPPRR